MEEKTPNEMEMAAQENEEREKVEETAQGWVNKDFYFLNILDRLQMNKANKSLFNIHAIYQVEVKIP